MDLMENLPKGMNALRLAALPGAEGIRWAGIRLDADSVKALSLGNGPAPITCLKLLFYPGYGKVFRQIGFFLRIAASPKPRVGKAFAQLHCGLIQRIDAHEPARKQGGRLKQQHERTRSAGAAVVHFYMQQGHAALAQGHARSQGFGLQQAAKGFGTQPGPYIGHIHAKIGPLRLIAAG